MYKDLACISNAFNAWSHLSHSGLSAAGLPLFCQSVEQLKRDLPSTLARVERSDSIVAVEENVHRLSERGESEREKQSEGYTNACLLYCL